LNYWWQVTEQTNHFSTLVKGKSYLQKSAKKKINYKIIQTATKKIQAAHNGDDTLPRSSTVVLKAHVP